jgi:hypothetical protein
MLYYIYTIIYGADNLYIDIRHNMFMYTSTLLLEHVFSVRLHPGVCQNLV